MKPIIIKVSKDKRGNEYATLTLQEFEAAIDNAYQAGMIDGQRMAETDAVSAKE